MMDCVIDIVVIEQCFIGCVDDCIYCQGCDVVLLNFDFYVFVFCL